MDFLTVSGLALGIIGATASVWFLWERFFPCRRLSWRRAEKAAARFVSDMATDSFTPTLIVGIGRGGAIMGALVSAALGHRSLVVIDRKYSWRAGRRDEDMILHTRFPEDLLESVLLIAGEVHSGRTMRMYYDYFSRLGAKRLARATLFLQQGATEQVEYVGVSSDRTVRLPWMFCEEYIRADRSAEEAKSLDVVLTSSQRRGDESHRVCFLVRHGESADNAAGDRFSGITDSEITERGLRQATETGRALQDETVERIYSSPMKRAVATARVLHAKVGGMILIDPRLRELDYGEWEGLTRQEVHERWPALYDAWKEDPVGNAPKGSENPQEALKRICGFWQDLVADMAQHNVETVAVVTHKSTVRLLLGQLAGQPVSEYRKRRSSNSSLTKVVIERNGEASIVWENRTDHLSDSDL